MQNGLYKAEFSTLIGSGIGVVSLVENKISGGDMTMYYIGTYLENNSSFTANIKVATHTRIPGITTVFGRDDVNVDLSGTITGTNIKATGTSPQAPGIQFQASLSLLAPD